MRLRIVWIEFDHLAELLASSYHLLTARIHPKVRRAMQQLMSPEPIGTHAGCPLPFCHLGDPAECRNDRSRRLVLHHKHVFKFAIVPRCPHMRPCRRLDELSCDADTMLRFTHTSF